MTQPVAPMGNNRIGMHVTILIRELVRQNERYREALENIANAAQAASMHQPEQFCEWAYNAVEEALQETLHAYPLNAQQR